jgi:hypothetical protein
MRPALAILSKQHPFVASGSTTHILMGQIPLDGGSPGRATLIGQTGLADGVPLYGG